VTGFDTDAAKVAAIAKNASPIDDVTDHDLTAMHAAGTYRCSDDPSILFAGFDTAVVTVPTPLKNGAPDLTAVLSAARTIGCHVRPGALVVLESTVAPGTTRGAFTEALAAPGVHVAFSPERIDPGNQLWTFERTPKLVGGTSITATQLACDFYNTVCKVVVPVDDAEVAEAAKLLENTYRHVNVALVNELGRHLHGLDIDVWQVIEAAATKPYGFQAFYPGPGVGGHCLPIDPAYLSDVVERLTGNPFRFVDLAMQINASQPGYVVQRVAELLNEARLPVNGSTIVALGATYKRDSGDLRESPALPVIRRLAELGAHVQVCDPHADQQALAGLAVDIPDGVTVIGLDELGGRLGGCHAAVLLTDHTGFPYHLLANGLAPRVLDTRGRFIACANATNVTTL
jgi:nucleotide sugar dehydrogenase